MLCPTWLAVTYLSSTLSSIPTSTSWNLQQQESHHQLQIVLNLMCCKLRFDHCMVYVGSQGSALLSSIHLTFNLSTSCTFHLGSEILREEMKPQDLISHRLTSVASPYLAKYSTSSTKTIGRRLAVPGSFSCPGTNPTHSTPGGNSKGLDTRAAISTKLLLPNLVILVLKKL